ncbi:MULTISPECIES: ABC transporter permease [unclassified Leucobacter]|uniref:ABC transporter permease n=1 Tax=unclassified Leucobacter TaxID=2621730 RepID=UPI00165D37E5|nr:MULTISPECIES: ABC transporter permease [unclassified Leucobacter]MBC9928364.1 ABC transporter permease [Leucobacter sp. cx-169]MBC9936115.1 ABC transporter permease [Leucobacter sp. cx-87]
MNRENPSTTAPDTGAPPHSPRASDEAADVRHTGSTWRYLLVKAGGSAVSLLMVVVLGFFAFRVLPGDPVAVLTRGRQVTNEQIAQLRDQLGLDRPILVQFWEYLVGLLKGDLGDSFVFRTPVTQLMGQYVGPTLLLMSVSMVLTVSIGVWVGQRAAWKRGGWFDRSATWTSLFFWSMPTFWFGLLLLLVFSGTGLFPSSGMTTVGAGYTGWAYVLDVARHLVLPVLALSIASYAQYVLIMRSSLLEELGQDYLVTARAKGLPEDLVRRRHALPNALLPTVTMIFLQLAGLISGAVTVETVFSWPGLGYLTFQAIQGPDFPVLQGTFVVFSSIVIFMNFFADILYRAIDPRVRAA